MTLCIALCCALFALAALAGETVTLRQGAVPERARAE